MSVELPKLLYRWVDRKDANIKRVELEYYVSDKQGIAADLAQYTIKSTGKTMTAGEYLSTDKGVGGNITGFMEYHPTHTQETRNILEGTPAYYSLSRSHRAFGLDRDLFIFPTASISPEDQDALVWTTGDLEDTLRSCPKKIKVAKLGSLMETTTHYGNDSEWNFIPNYGFTVLGLLIRFGKYYVLSEETEEKNGKKITKTTSVFKQEGINWNGLEEYVNSFYKEFENFKSVKTKYSLPFSEC